MEQLTTQEYNFVKRLFIVNASNYFKDVETLKIMSEAFRKITDKDLKFEWENWTESINKLFK